MPMETKCTITQENAYVCLYVCVVCMCFESTDLHWAEAQARPGIWCVRTQVDQPMSRSAKGSLYLQRRVLSEPSRRVGSVA